MATPADLPFEGKTVRALVGINKERAFKFFEGTPFTKEDTAEAASQRVKLSCKFRDEYSSTVALSATAQPSAVPLPTENGGAPGGAATAKAPVSKSSMALVISDLSNKQQLTTTAEAARLAREALAKPRATVPVAGGGVKEYVPSAAIAKRLASRWPRPEWHAPWKCYRVIAGHLGWVRSIAFDVGNEWFATGSADRTIKLWDTATGGLKITLTGHIEQVTGLAVSPRHPYMFSCGLDKKVMNWDLEQNKVIRHYHGHLSGVYALAIHPELDLLMTGGRDSVCRVWDMRSKVQIFCLSGHSATVASILPGALDPQIITGSHDTTIRTWDLRNGKCLDTLTYHKHSVRALAASPNEWAFMAASADNVKKYKLPEGQFAHNMIQNQRAIINAMAINADGVVATGADNGSLWFWDYLSGNCFQQGKTIAQPGSLESEAGIFAMSYDQTGTRLVTCEADKSIKMWKEDTSATPETHPVQFRPPKDIVRRYG